MSPSNLLDTVKDYLQPVLHPIEWMKGNFAESFCISFFAFLLAWYAWIAMLCMNLLFVSKIFLGFSILSASFFVFALVCFIISNAQKEAEATERRIREAERKVGNS